MTCCGNPVVDPTTTSTTTPPPGSNCCLRTRYVCQCIDGVDTWVLDVGTTDCIPNDQCINGQSCSAFEFVQETINGCICLDPLPALPVPTCTPNCCDSSTTTTPPDSSTTTSTSSTTSSTSTTTAPPECADPVVQNFPSVSGGFTFDTVVAGDVTTLENFQAGPCAGGGSIDYGTFLQIDLEDGCCYQIEAELALNFGAVDDSCADITSGSVLNVLDVFTACDNITSADQSDSGSANPVDSPLSVIVNAFRCGGSFTVFANLVFDSSGACDCSAVFPSAMPTLTGFVRITKLGACPSTTTTPPTTTTSSTTTFPPEDCPEVQPLGQNITFDTAVVGNETTLDNFVANCPGGTSFDGSIQFDFLEPGCCYEFEIDLSWVYACDDSCGPVANQKSLDFVGYTDCTNAVEDTLNDSGSSSGDTLHIQGTRFYCADGITSIPLFQFQFIQDGGACADICAECSFGQMTGSIIIRKLGACEDQTTTTPP